MGNKIGLVALILAAIPIFFKIPRVPIKLKTAVLVVVAACVLVWIFTPEESTISRPQTEEMNPGEEESVFKEEPILEDNSYQDKETINTDANLNPDPNPEISEDGDEVFDDSAVLDGEEVLIANSVNYISGAILDDGQVDTYWIIPDIPGRYRFEVTDLDPEVEVDLALCNALGNVIESTSYGIGNGEGITVNGLEANQQYQITVSQYSKYSKYTLLIGSQTGTTDISGLTCVSDTIEYTDQVVNYMYTPTVSGRYRFEVSDLDPKVEVDIAIYNALGNELASTSYGIGNGEGITVNGLEANQQYQIEISQYSKYSKYTLLIGAQTTTTDISGLTQVSGDIEYTDEIVNYTYTPVTSGRYRFEVSDLDPKVEVDIALYNELGNVLESTSYGVGNGGGITVDGLEANQQYQIQVSQYNKYGEYTLLIGAQTATTDISELTRVSGNIEYTDQMLNYIYTPTTSGRYRFELSDLDPEVKVDIVLYNASGNELASTSYGAGNGEGITVDNLESGQQYQVLVSQYEHFGTFSMMIDCEMP